MLVHHIKSSTAANTLPHRSSSVAPGKEPGSRAEFSSDKDAADIHVHAYAPAPTAGRSGMQREAKHLAAVHGN